MAAQHLWGPGRPSPADVVRRLVAVQAQEHPYARWSVAQRTAGTPDAVSIDEAFDAGRFLRTHVLRPTWHYVAPEELRWLIRLSGPRLIAASARRYAELEIDNRTAERAADLIAAAATAEPCTRHELAAVLEQRGIATTGQRLPHLLMHAELTGRVCSGPMRGKHHTYMAIDQRTPPGDGPDGDEALAALAERYFTTRGPATVDDFAWWSGLPAALARRGVELARGSLASGDGYWWEPAAESSPPAEPSPRIDLVQCYDEAIISYRSSRGLLHTADVSFKVPPPERAHVLLQDGRLLGQWKGRGGGVETRPARPLSGEEERALQAAVDRYLAFLYP